MVDSTLEARLAQLEQAKTLVDADASYFPQIVVGVLPVFDDALVELRRWVSDFTLLAFSSRKVSVDDKLNLALQCLGTLAASVANESDLTTAKNFIQISTLIYPALFRHVANNPQSSQVWSHLTNLKSAVLKFWDATGEGLRICCIKFAQRVVSVQSAGAKDPRLANRDDISLNLVLSEHPLLHLRDLNAEAQALLDRLLAILQEKSSDAVLTTAAINCLCVLARTRQAFAGKIINGLLSYDSADLDVDESTMKGRLQIKFIEKAVRVGLTHLLKVNAAGPSGSKIQQFLLGKVKKSGDEMARKRQASETVESNGKRLRSDLDGFGTPQPSVLSIPPLPEGPVSLAMVFNLANDNALASFDVNQLPQELVVQIILATLLACNQEHLESSVETIRARHAVVQNRPAVLPSAAPTSVDVLDSSKEANNLVQASNPAPALLAAAAPPGPFQMPEAPVLTQDSMIKLSQECVSRLLKGQAALRKSSSTLPNVRDGLQKVIGSSWDREAWLGVVTRLPARALASVRPVKGSDTVSIADRHRTQLMSYIMTNFRENIEFCTSWLTEEWYSDSLEEMDTVTNKAYDIWTNKVLDAIIPFLEAKDRLFVRFLSDLPELHASMIARIRTLCVDPDRSQLGYTALQYLIMLRPPVRTNCLDLVEELYHEDKSEVLQQEKILNKWRPNVVVKTEQ